MSPKARTRLGLTAGAALLVSASVASVIAFAWGAEEPERAGVPSARTSGAFTFDTVGDHGLGKGAVEVLQEIGHTRSDFLLSLGDLAYEEGPGVPEAFCAMVKDSLNAGAGLSPGDEYGETFPVQIVEGNHDNDLQAYLAEGCLPQRISSRPSGLDDPGKAYTFDFPTAEPLARFIVLPSGGVKMYSVGSRRYQWVSDSIDQAREAGIRWVIVAQHKNYISAGEKQDEVGPDLFNLLISKKVDLLLQGHDHNYQRSKQLALSPECAAVPTGTTDPACIVDDGSDGAYEAGGGTVLAIVGTGGRDNYEIIESDPEAAYFARLLGSDADQVNGFLHVTVSPAALDVTFEEVDGRESSTRDEFTIKGSP